MESEIIHGDCISRMADMEPDSVDAIVTDPPYGLEFMGKDWDAHSSPPAYQAWTTLWAIGALRVLKPGGSMLAFGGDRTHHRMMCGVEDAGFTIKTSIMWLFGSGFPKAQDLGKMLDKRAGVERETAPNPLAKQQTAQEETSALHAKGASPAISFPATDLACHWDGYKIGGIKPAFEIIAWTVKPPEGSWTDNVLAYGVGAVNVDECRIGTEPRPEITSDGKLKSENKAMAGHNTGRVNTGRFPANLVLTHHPECRRVGTRRVRGSNFGGSETGRVQQVYGEDNRPRPAAGYADADGLETVETWECQQDCPVRMLDEQSGVSKSSPVATERKPIDDNGCYGGSRQSGLGGHADTGGASRFFYCAKATDRQDFNNHPTLKPTPVMEWLIRLVTRPGQIVLDPFAGSGTTGVAAVQSGRGYILVEQDAGYCAIADRRLSEVQMGMF